jgi:glucosamine--fructose-6-phosphate aminotransferase (isomerizing)
MCGVFGIVLNKSGNVCNLIIEGLIQLQNRGYDSAGLCVIKNGKLDVHKYASTSTLSAIEKLKNACLEMDEEAFIGIGHNRGATHGVKNDTNAHPLLSNNK